jgi:hypothetical protein
MLGYELMKEEITRHNYRHDEPMHCQKCGHEWTFAVGERELDGQRNITFMSPKSPCCRESLIKGAK